MPTLRLCARNCFHIVVTDGRISSAHKSKAAARAHCDQKAEVGEVPEWMRKADLRWAIGQHVNTAVPDRWTFFYRPNDGFKPG